MLRDKGLRGRRRAKRDDMVNPLEFVANLADVMLVFACGLMISVIMFWNVDVNHATQVVSKENLVEAGDMEKALENGNLSSKYKSKGIAYEDPKTGKMYIIMP